MSGSTKQIDARGMACPQPVLSLKKALEEGGFDRIEMLVDNAAAKENVSRFAQYSGNEVISVEETGAAIAVLVGVRTGAAQADAAAKVAVAACDEPEGNAAAARTGATLLVRSARIGDSAGGGDDELGTLLMRAFLATLSESEGAPRRVILMNGGVHLAVQGADAVESLRKLEAAGIEVLACGTCLKFFHLEEKLAVGRISNMYEIAGALLEGRVISL